MFYYGKCSDMTNYRSSIDISLFETHQFSCAWGFIPIILPQSTVTLSRTVSFCVHAKNGMERLSSHEKLHLSSRIVCVLARLAAKQFS